MSWKIILMKNKHTAKWTSIFQSVVLILPLYKQGLHIFSVILAASFHFCFTYTVTKAKLTNKHNGTRARHTTLAWSLSAGTWSSASACGREPRCQGMPDGVLVGHSLVARYVDKHPLYLPAGGREKTNMKSPFTVDWVLNMQTVGVLWMSLLSFSFNYFSHFS